MPKVTEVLFISSVGLFAGTRRPLMNVPCVYSHKATLYDPEKVFWQQTPDRWAHRLQIDKIGLAVFVMYEGCVLSGCSGAVQNYITCRCFSSEQIISLAVYREACLLVSPLVHLRVIKKNYMRCYRATSCSRLVQLRELRVRAVRVRAATQRALADGGVD